MKNLLKRYFAGTSVHPATRVIDGELPAEPWEQVKAELGIVTQCTSTTKAGNPCKLPPLPDSDKCVIHKPKTEPLAS